MRSSYKWNIPAGHWTIKLGRQKGRLLHWPKCSCVSTKTKLWKLLLRPAVCIPSLIVQWPARSYHFQPLRMIVKLAYRLGKEALAKPVGRSFSAVLSYLLRDVVLSTYLARPRHCHVQDVVHFVFSVIPSPKDALRLPRKVGPKFHYPLFRKETS